MHPRRIARPAPDAASGSGPFDEAVPVIKFVADIMLAALSRGAGLRPGSRPEAPSAVRLSRSLVSMGRPVAIGRAANENDADGGIRSRARPF